LYFLLLWICLLQAPHINRIIQKFSFCDWLISLRIMSSRKYYLSMLKHVSELLSFFKNK
jgi:hypothetical protein